MFLLLIQFFSEFWYKIAFFHFSIVGEGNKEKRKLFYFSVSNFVLLVSPFQRHLDTICKYNEDDDDDVDDDDDDDNTAMTTTATILMVHFLCNECNSEKV